MRALFLQKRQVNLKLPVFYFKNYFMSEPKVIPASFVLNLDQDFEINPEDKLEILEFSFENNREIVLLKHLKTSNTIKKDLFEINFTLH